MEERADEEEAEAPPRRVASLEALCRGRGGEKIARGEPRNDDVADTRLR
jgi:hypothetical protein